MTTLAFDDTGGSGPLLVLLPGAGDVRSEYRFLAATLAADGYRIVTADLPGHGDSPLASEYTVESTGRALVDLVDILDAGPAVVVACSFAPTAAVWAATIRPELIAGIVALSPHFDADESTKGRMMNLAIRGMLRGPWAGGLWAKLYAAWYKTNPPSDLETEIERMRVMLADPARRKAVRDTLTAARDGVAAQMERLAVPTLTVFGSADDHFADPVAEAAEVAGRLGGEHLVVKGAGHYPHVEQPQVVADAIRSFLDR
ncbi:MAG: alpha/beta fold hydrolase [Acidimicrobiia bacterium]